MIYAAYLCMLIWFLCSYCECFAAELYCGEPCSCLGCLNRPEFRDNIYKIRNQIKSRDQFAFAPKLVQINDIDIPSNNTVLDTCA